MHPHRLLTAMSASTGDKFAADLSDADLEAAAVVITRALVDRNAAVRARANRALITVADEMHYRNS